MNGLDIGIFKAINGWPEESAPFWIFLSNAVKRTDGLVLLGVVVGGLLAWKKTRIATLFALLSWPLADGTTNVLKHMLKWPRPCWPNVLLEHPDFHVRVEALTSFGTASAHSANMMAIATCFLWLYRPVGYVWLVVAVLTGLSRIYVGVHWPSQVLLGWVCGALCGTVMVKTIESAQRILAAKKQAPPASPAEVP